MERAYGKNRTHHHWCKWSYPRRFKTAIKEKLNIDVDCREIQKIVFLGTVK